MFDFIVMRKASNADQYDVGLLAEALLFYQKVHLTLDRPSFLGLIAVIGFPTLMRLLESQYATATYFRDLTAVSTTSGLHSFIEFRVGSRNQGPKSPSKPKLSYEEEIADLLAISGLDPKEAKRSAKRFVKNVPKSDYRKLQTDRSLISDDFIGDLHLGLNVGHQAKIVLQNLLPGEPGLDFTHFELVEMPKKTFVVNTNLNWNHAKSAFARRFGSTATLTEGRILSEIFNAHIDLRIAASYGAELVTTPLSESLITNRVDWAMRRRTQSAGEVLAFCETVLSNGRAVRDAINTKARSFDEFLELLDHASRFKSMLKGAHPDKNLLDTYNEEMTKGTWLDRLLPKSMRFGLTTLAGPALDLVLAGGAATTVQTALSAFDQFLLDKLIRGWRPNVFVDQQLRPFVDEA